MSSAASSAFPRIRPAGLPAIPEPRDTRIDVLRAICLLTIFINHVPGNPLEPLTHKNFGFSDAAEAFVLLSGVAAAIAYGGRFERGQALLASLLAFRRAGVLYVAQLATTLFALASFVAMSLLFARPDLLEHIAIPRVMQMPAEALLGIVTLGHQLGYNNILSTYVVLLLMLPPMLLIARRSLGMMLALSFGLWLSAGLMHVAPYNWPGEGVWFLNPLSWQFLFFIGVGACLHCRNGGSLPRSPWLVGFACFYLLLSFAWVNVPLWFIDTSFGLPEVLTGWSKTYLSTFRLLHVLAAAYLIAVIAPVSAFFRLSPVNPLAVMGRHGLPVFIAGTMLSMVLMPLRLAMPLPPVLDLLAVLAGCGLLFALVYWLEFVGRLKKSAATSRLPLPPRAAKQPGAVIGPAE